MNNKQISNPIKTKELTQYKSRDFLLITCPVCNKTFKRKKHKIQSNIKKGSSKTQYCSSQCKYKNHLKQSTCLECNNEFYHKKSVKRKFCSKSCATSYNNKHKTVGTTRSKLEQYIEEVLTKEYPNLEIHFNKKDAIQSELDIYIPSLKLAFELNGVFHYEPIFGAEKLKSIKNNDNRKFQACLENGIELCIINTSNQKYFKPEKSAQYINIIKQTINNKKEADAGLEPA